MPAMDGPTLQRTLAERKISIPIVFLTGAGSIPIAVEAMKAGAVSFLEKPFDNQALIDQVTLAFAQDTEQRAAVAKRQVVDQRLAVLTPREREVMVAMANGGSNKEIARLLGISDRTVEIHRARVMEKLGVDSVAEIVRLSLQADIRSTPDK